MKNLSLAAVLALVLVFSGCTTSGGSGGKTAVTLTPSAAQMIDQGQQVVMTAAVANDSAGAGVTWGCAGAACTTLASVSTTAATFNASGATGAATITATSVTDPTATANLAITVSAAPAVTTTQAQVTAAPGTAGVAYSLTAAATGGAGALTWSATGLADGLSINSSTGVISGTPTSKSTVTFTVTVTDSSTAGAKSASSGSLSLTVNDPAPPTITTTQAQLTAAPATAGSAYHFTFQGTGTGALTWSATGLPADSLSLAASSGTVSGTPPAKATLSLVVTVSDTFGQSSAPTAFVLTVNDPPAPVITTTQAQVTAAPATNGTHYTFTFHATGTGTLTWSSTGLPADGLSLNTATGVVSGTPTSAASVAITLTVSDTFGQSTAATPFTITVNNPPAPVITTTQAQVTAAPATNGTAYSFTFHATGTGTLTWSSTGLPADGLSLNPATGVVSGTPTAAAAVAITLTVSDTFGQSTAATPFTITVNNPPAPVITTTQAQVTAAPASNGTAYSFTFHATGTGTLTWSSTGLPADGLSLNPATGVVSGTPTAQQSVPITLTVSDTFGQSTAAKPFTITVNNPAPPVITTKPNQVPGATVNIPYSFTFQGTGFGTLAWSTTPALSDSLSINGGTGQVTGTPPTAETLNFSVTLTDGVGQQTTVTGFSIVVSMESIAFTPAAPSSVTAGGQLSVNATVSNDAGAGGVDWTVTCTSGPCGSFTAAHTASGTATTFNAPAQPPSGGTVTITATAHDAPSPQVSAVVTVNPMTLIITTASLPDGTVNASYNATITASGGVAPYTFTMDAGSTALPANLVFNPGSPSATITGTPTATGTTNNIIIDVADSEGSPMTAQMTFSITVNAVTAACGSGSESLLNGQYAMLLQGFDSSGPVGIGATFNADGGGNIATTVGIEDINSVAGVQTDLSIISASSSYSVGSDHRGCLTIATSAGTQIFRFALSGITAGISSVGNVIEFDATGSNAAGMFGLQDPTAFSNAKIKGNYAFGVSGPEVGGGKFAAVGVFSFNGTGGFNTTPASVVDFSDNGNVDGNGSTYPASPVSLGGASYFISANGRGTFSFLPGGGGSTTQNTVLYVLSSSEVIILSTNSQTSDNLFTGSAALQSGGTFTDSSMSNSSVLYATGIGNNGGTPASLAFGAIFTVTSSGVASLNGWSSSGGGVEAQSGSGITFSVASSGRVTFPAQAGNHQTPIFYLIKPNKGYLLFTDGTSPNPKVQSGAFRPQSAGPFSTSTLDAAFAFGTTQPDVLGIDQETGIAAFDGSGNITGTSDGNNSGTLQANQAFTGTYSIDSTGVGLVPSGCTIGTNCNNVFFLISPTSFVLLDTSDDINPDVELVEE